MNPFIIRPAMGDDIPFIFSTWLRSYKYDSDFGKPITKSIFFKNYQLVLDNILNTSRVLVACLPDDPKVILSYLVFQDNTLHYIFTKESFRQLGIANALLAEAFGNHSKSIVITHRTDSAEPIIEKKQFLYNPILLFSKECNEES